MLIRLHIIDLDCCILRNKTIMMQKYDDSGCKLSGYLTGTETNTVQVKVLLKHIAAPTW